MLPRPGGAGTPDFNWFCACPGPRAIRHNPVHGPVAAAYNISGPYRSAGRARREKAQKIGMGYNFRTALRGRIGIRAAKTICFAIAPDPFVIAVAFVGCDYHPGPDLRQPAHGFEHIHRAQHICFKSGHGRFVGLAHQGLRRQMENNVRPEIGHCFFYLVRIAHVTTIIREAPGKSQAFEIGRACGNIVRKAGHIGPKSQKPGAEP